MWRAVDMVLLFLADTLIRSANLCIDLSAITHKLILPTIHHAGKWPRHICSVMQIFSPISWSSPPVLSHRCDANCLARHFMAKKHKVILCPLSSFGLIVLISHSSSRKTGTESKSGNQLLLTQGGDHFFCRCHLKGEPEVICFLWFSPAD